MDLCFPAEEVAVQVMNQLSLSQVSCASSVFAKATLPRQFDAWSVKPPWASEVTEVFLDLEVGCQGCFDSLFGDLGMGMAKMLGIGPKDSGSCGCRWNPKSQVAYFSRHLTRFMALLLSLSLSLSLPSFLSSHRAFKFT